VNGKEWFEAVNRTFAALEELAIERCYKLRPGRWATFRVHSDLVRGPGAPESGVYVPKIHITVKNGAASEPLKLSDLTVTDLHMIASLREQFEDWIAGRAPELPKGDD